MLQYVGIKAGSRKLYPTATGYRASATYIIKGVNNQRQIYNMSEIPKYGDTHPDEPSIFAKEFDMQVIDGSALPNADSNNYSECVELTVTYGPPSGRIDITPHLQSVTWNIATENRHVDLDAFGSVVGSAYLYSNNNGSNPSYPPGFGQANILTGSPLVISDFFNRPIPSGRDEDAKLGQDILVPKCEASVVLPVTNTWYNVVSASQQAAGSYNTTAFVLDGYTIPPYAACLTKISAEPSTIQNGSGNYIKRVSLTITVGFQTFPPPSSYRLGYKNPDWTPYLINGQAPNSSQPIILPQGYDCYPIYDALNKPPVDVNGNPDSTAKTPFKWAIVEGDTKIYLALDKDRVAAKSANAMVVFKKKANNYDFNLIGLV